MGLKVVDDEEAGAEEEQTEEDREVQKIVDQGRAVKRKIITGTFIYVCMSVCMYSMSKMSKHCKYCISSSCVPIYFIMSKGSKLKNNNLFQLLGLLLWATGWLRMGGECWRKL